MFGFEPSATPPKKWPRLKPNEIKSVFYEITYGAFMNHPTHAHNVNAITEKIVVSMKGMRGHEIGMSQVTELEPFKTC